MSYISEGVIKPFYELFLIITVIIGVPTGIQCETIAWCPFSLFIVPIAVFSHTYTKKILAGDRNKFTITMSVIGNILLMAFYVWLYYAMFGY